jgi:superfamily II DNA or RNA helicase
MLNSLYKNKYTTLVNQYRNKTLIIENHKIYEYLWAISEDMILWDDIPPGFELIHELPHRMDYGIDLISLDFTKTGQAKNYGPNSMITWSDISKYNTYSTSILGISNLNILTTTVAKIDKMVLRLFNKPHTIIKRMDFNDLLELVPDTNNLNLTVSEQPKTVIEHRSYTIECTKLFIESNKQLLRFQLPCGIGKSFIIYNIISETLKLESTSKFLIVVPWKDLASQMLNQLVALDIKAGLIGAGSRKINACWNVVICITASIHLIPSDIHYKYKFIDEAHHVENSESVYLEKINQVVCDKELHLSATFRKTKELDYSMNLRDAIDSGWLCDYVFHIEYFTSGDKTQALVDLVKNNMEWAPMFIYFNDTQRAIEFSERLNLDGVRADYITGNSTSAKRLKVVEDIKNRVLPVLCLCGCFNEGISIDCLQTIIYGDLRYSKVNRIQTSMRACRKYVDKPFYRLVVPMQDENLDDGDLDSLVKTFYSLDPKFKEAIDNKSISRVKFRLDEQIIDDDSSESAKLIGERVYNSLGEMISNVGVNGFMEMYEKLKMWVEENGRLPNKRAICTLEKKYGIWRSHILQDKNMNRLTNAKIILLEQIPNWKWSIKSTSKPLSFDEMYKLVKEWVDKNGRIPNKRATCPFEKKYGKWASHKREDKKNGKLTNSQINLLNQILGWYWGSNEKITSVSFDDTYILVKDWIIENKKLPSAGSSEPNEYRYGSWISRKRADKKNGTLSEEQINLLEALPGWNWGNDTLFIENYNEMKNWIIEHDKNPSRVAKDPVERKIAERYSQWRNRWTNNKFDDEKSKLLEQLPNWVNDIPDPFYDNYEKVKEWILINDKLPAYNAKDKSLESKYASWCARILGERSRLSDDKIKLLEGLKYWFWSSDEKFTESYNNLIKWIDENDRLPISNKIDKLEHKYYDWCRSQRKKYINNKLDENTINLLEAVSHWKWM